MANTHLIRQQHSGDDEYYTLYDSVKRYIENNKMQPYFKDKIVYCFCDSEQSNIVKYLKDNKDELKYKELIYTSDDYHLHSDLFEKADILFTNPPFKHYIKFLTFVDKFNKDFILWAPKSATYLFRFLDRPTFIQCCIGEDSNYERPDGTLKDVATYICTTFKVEETKQKIEFCSIDELLKIGKITKLKAAYIRDEKLMNTEYKYRIKDVLHIPNDYYGPMLIPVSTFIYTYHFFDVLYDLYDLNYCIIGVKENGRHSYRSVAVKLKDKYKN